jgi:hypothetical protein
VKVIRVRFEGSPALGPGFRAFYRSLVALARERNVDLQFRSGKSGPQVKRDVALDKKQNPEQWIIALLDSEGEAFDAEDPDVFWMVEVMEAWFLADPEALGRFYGRNATLSALPGTQDVESIPKARVMTALKELTRTTKKGKYHKTVHAPEILKQLNTERVRKAAKNCNRMFREIERRLPGL